MLYLNQRVWIIVGLIASFGSVGCGGLSSRSITADTNVGNLARSTSAPTDVVPPSRSLTPPAAPAIPGPILPSVPIAPPPTPAAMFPIDTLVSPRAIPTSFGAVGGSNYVFIEESSYTSEPMSASEQTDCYVEGGHKTQNRRSVIGVYHLAKPQIDRQLLNLYNSGQRKISFVIWHFTNPYLYPGDMHCMALKVQGILSLQHRVNLKAIVLQAKQIGFNQINIRFAPSDQSDPLHWSAWSEDQFQSNWNLAVNARSQVYEALGQVSGSGPVRILFDLGVELGGAWVGTDGRTAKPVLREYATRLWRQYIQNFGAQDTMGFSIVPAWQNRLIDSVRIYDEAGVRPVALGFDLYGNMEAVARGDISSLDYQLKLIRDELSYTGQLGSREIIVQETYSSNPAWSQRLVSESQRLGLRFQTVFQWPFDLSGRTVSNLNDFVY